MIRSSKISLKFANSGKLQDIDRFITEYQRVMALVIAAVWDTDKVNIFVKKDVLDPISKTTWLSKRAMQCLAKQASGIVRGARLKERRCNYIIDKLTKEGRHKQARKLFAKTRKYTPSEPSLSSVCPELDQRFVKVSLSSANSFDGWITLSSIGNKLKIVIPFKRHTHFNKLMAKGILKRGLRLSRSTATLMFDIPDPVPAAHGSTLGVDVGQNSVLACSSGQLITQDKDGHSYLSICQKLAKKQRGSNAFRRTERHRTNFINWSINQLNLDGVKKLQRENIKYLRNERKTRRVLTHWNYAELFERLDRKAEELGVQVVRLSPTYTSQRCSRCGWVRKSNRNKKLFRCGACGYTTDSDLNASSNLALNLVPIGRQERLSQKNRVGFYWPEMGQEPIVPAAKKLSLNKIQ